MFSQKIAQANISNSNDNTLQNLNVKLDLLKEEYNAVASQPNSYSFFNLDNIYFWFVLAGLLLLAFGLLFLLAELQNKSNKNKKAVSSKDDQSDQIDEVDESVGNEADVPQQAVATLKDLGVDTSEIEAEVKAEVLKIKKVKKNPWFKKTKPTKTELVPTAKESQIIDKSDAEENIETQPSKVKGPIKIKVEKVK